MRNRANGAICGWTRDLERALQLLAFVGCAFQLRPGRGQPDAPADMLTASLYKIVRHERHGLLRDHVDALSPRADKKSNIQYTKAAFVSEDPDNDKPEALAKLLEGVGAVGPKTEQRIMALTGPQVDKARLFLVHICHLPWQCLQRDLGLWHR